MLVSSTEEMLFGAALSVARALCEILVTTFSLRRPIVQSLILSLFGIAAAVSRALFKQVFGFAEAKHKSNVHLEMMSHTRSVNGR
jgi:hypothetical protein